MQLWLQKSIEEVIRDLPTIEEMIYWVKMVEKLSIAWLFFRVNMPDNVVWETEDAIACSFGHLCETLRFRLIFKCVARKVDT